jgi:hypothetical protein
MPKIDPDQVERMPVTLEIMKYRGMAGRYIRASCRTGWQNIGGNPSGGPAFTSEAKARAWIDNHSAEWLRQFENSDSNTLDRY